SILGINMALYLIYAASVVAAYEIGFIIHQLYFSPLRDIPGPRLAAISSLWCLYHGLMRNQKFLEIEECHKKYGPVVRIGPNNVVVKDSRSLKSIYLGKLDKVAEYDALRTNNGTPTAFSCIDQSESTGKRRYAPGITPYSNDTLEKWHPMMLHHIEHLLGILNCKPEQPVDVLSLCMHLLIDRLADVLLKNKPGALQNFENGRPNPLSVHIHGWFKRNNIKRNMPNLISNVLEYVPIKNWQDITLSDTRFADYVRPLVRNLRSDVDTGGPPEIMCLAERLSTAVNPHTQQLWPESHIVSECIDHFLAGAETSSIAISYTLYNLARFPAIQKKIYEEIDDATRDASQLLTIHVLAQLPYLNAVIKESLRMYPPSPGTLERVVPSDGLTFFGHYLPSGTAVGIQTWSLHYDEEVFPEPAVFIPFRRVLPANLTSYSICLITLSVISSVGGRSCPGKNLAWVDMRLVIASIVLHFDIKLPSWTNEDTMAPQDLSETLSPKSGKCDLVFVPRLKA
ncbi:cytochrome P450, partial [Crucibulum laeve]